MKYRKKPVVIDADQWIPTHPNSKNVQLLGLRIILNNNETCVEIPTLEGNMIARPTDWIIRGINGEYYPVKDEIFLKTYEKVEE